MPNAYNVWSVGTEAQIERWLRPMLRGEAQDAYAVTEALAGSDPSAIATTATPSDGGWRIRGEKWFVTSGDVADVIIVVAVAPEGPTLFLVPTDAPGVTVVDDPDYTHFYPHGHPNLGFDVQVGPEALLGPLGGADDLQRAWFTEERIGIAARGRRRDAAAARGDGRVRHRARAGRRAAVGPPGRARSRWPTRLPTPRPGGC